MAERFFDTIDTERKAYWLGYVLGKGRVFHDPDPCLHVRFHVGEGHTQFLLDARCCPVTHKPGDKYSTLIIRDVPFVRSLARYGLVPGKSTLAKGARGAIERVPDALFFHFMRGVMDANGRVLSTNRKGQAEVRVHSSDVELMEYLGERTAALLGLPPSSLDHGRLGTELRYCGRLKCLRLREALYQGASRWNDYWRERLYQIPSVAERPPGVKKSAIPIPPEVRHLVTAVRAVVPRKTFAALSGVNKNTIARIEAGEQRFLEEEHIGKLVAYGMEHRIGPFA